MRLIEIAQAATRMPKLSRREQLLDFLRVHPSSKLNNVGITYTMLPKVGVNPQSLYSTPIGVYFYPAQYVLHRYDAQADVPFMGDAPFATAIDLSSLNLLVISDPSLDEHKLQNILYDNISKIASILHLTQDVVQAELDRAIELSTAEALVKDLPGGRFWYVLFYLTRLSITKINPSRAWTNILRMMGVDGVVDYGAGIIHRNENTQGFVVNTSKIKVIRQFSIRPHGTKDIHFDISRPKMAWFVKELQSSVEQLTFAIPDLDRASTWFDSIFHDIDGADTKWHKAPQVFHLIATVRRLFIYMTMKHGMPLRVRTVATGDILRKLVETYKVVILDILGDSPEVVEAVDVSVWSLYLSKIKHRVEHLVKLSDSGSNRDTLNPEWLRAAQGTLESSRKTMAEFETTGLNAQPLMNYYNQLKSVTTQLDVAIDAMRNKNAVK